MRNRMTTSQTVSDVVAGNRLKWEGSKGHFYKVSYPDGRQAYIPKSISQPDKRVQRSTGIAKREDGKLRIAGTRESIILIMHLHTL